MWNDLIGSVRRECPWTIRFHPQRSGICGTFLASYLGLPLSRFKDPPVDRHRTHRMDGPVQPAGSGHGRFLAQASAGSCIIVTEKASRPSTSDPRSGFLGQFLSVATMDAADMAPCPCTGSSGTRPVE